MVYSSKVRHNTSHTLRIALTLSEIHKLRQMSSTLKHTDNEQELIYGCCKNEDWKLR